MTDSDPGNLHTLETYCWSCRQKFE